MNEASTPVSDALEAIHTLADRIRRETPHLHVMNVLTHPYPFVKVKDSVYKLVVGFSSEADYVTYCQITSRKQASWYSSSNSLCRDLGHDWTLTTADNWRWCRREHCHASERLVNGRWVSNASLYRSHTPVIGGSRKRRQPEQATVWPTPDDPAPTPLTDQGKER